MNFPPSPTQAQCALHPSALATLTCARCGNFMCAECSDQGLATLCPPCRKLTGAVAFPFTRDDFDFGRLWEHVFALWRRDWVMLTVVALVAMLVPSLVSMPVGLVAGVIQGVAGAAMKDTQTMYVLAGLSQLVVLGVSMLAQAYTQLGIARVSLDALTGGKVDLARLFSQNGKVLRAIGITLLFGVAMVIALAAPMFTMIGAIFARADRDAAAAFGALGAGTIVLLLVGYSALVVMGMVWTVAIDELAYADCGAVEAIRRAWSLLEGMKWRGVGYFFIGGLVLVAGAAACCVGMLPAFGLTQLLLTGFYLCLRFGSALPPPAVAASRP